MKTVPTMQSKAYCWNCQQFLDADDLKQSWRATDELVCPDCGEPVKEKYQPE
jgi:predicted amidophosphoribosyltransferase